MMIKQRPTCSTATTAATAAASQEVEELWMRRPPLHSPSPPLHSPTSPLNNRAPGTDRWTREHARTSAHMYALRISHRALNHPKPPLPCLPSPILHSCPLRAFVFQFRAFLLQRATRVRCRALPCVRASVEALRKPSGLWGAHTLLCPCYHCGEGGLRMGGRGGHIRQNGHGDRKRAV